MSHCLRSRACCTSVNTCLLRDGVGVPCGWTEQWRGEALKELFIGQGGHCIVCYKTCFFFLVNHGYSESLFTFDSVKEMMPCHGTVAVLSGLILRRPLRACLWQLLGKTLVWWGRSSWASSQLFCQHEIKTDHIYSLMHVPGLIMHDSLVHVIWKKTKCCLCNPSSKCNDSLRL